VKCILLSLFLVFGLAGCGDGTRNATNVEKVSDSNNNGKIDTTGEIYSYVGLKMVWAAAILLPLSLLAFAFLPSPNMRRMALMGILVALALGPAGGGMIWIGNHIWQFTLLVIALVLGAAYVFRKELEVIIQRDLDGDGKIG